MRMAQPAGEERMIRRFLLGTLGEEQQEQVEERLLADADFRGEVRAARDELFDEYAGAALSREEREQFERRHLVTEEGRQKLLFAMSLRAHVASRAERPGLLSRFRRLMRAQRLGVALPVAAVLLLALALGVWRLRELGGPTDGPRRASAERAALERELAGLNPEGQGAVTTDAPPGAVFDAKLVRHLVRGGRLEQKLSVAGGVKVLRLYLVLEADRHESYRAVLLTGEDTELAAAGGLRPHERDGTRGVTLNLPAHALAPGDYQLRVEGVAAGGATAPVGLYPFRLVKE